LAPGRAQQPTPAANLPTGRQKGRQAGVAVATGESEGKDEGAVVSPQRRRARLGGLGWHRSRRSRRPARSLGWPSVCLVVCSSRAGVHPIRARPSSSIVTRDGAITDRRHGAATLFIAHRRIRQQTQKPFAKMRSPWQDGSDTRPPLGQGPHPPASTNTLPRASSAGSCCFAMALRKGSHSSRVRGTGPRGGRPAGRRHER
jgi:hypothetical protein